MLSDSVNAQPSPWSPWVRPLKLKKSSVSTTLVHLNGIQRIASNGGGFTDNPCIPVNSSSKFLTKKKQRVRILKTTSINWLLNSFTWTKSGCTAPLEQGWHCINYIQTRLAGLTILQIVLSSKGTYGCRNTNWCSCSNRPKYARSSDLRKDTAGDACLYL